MIRTMSTRRYGFYAILAALFLFAVTRYRESIASTIKYRYSFDASTVAKNASAGRFRWEDVPVQHTVATLTPLPTGKPDYLPKVQFDFPKESEADEAVRKKRQNAVKTTFQRCWLAYKELAWMRDEVTPLTGGHKDSFGGWAATLVDSLDTLWIMDMKDDFRQAVAAAMDIDLGMAATESVNVFETNIRHLGGFLSAYDLSGDKRLLDKAEEFGQMLLKAFDTPNRMPITRWNPQQALNGQQVADEVVLVAEIGSLSMEFTRLSQATGDMRYYDAINRVMQVFAAQQEKTQLPGMWPISVDARAQDFTRDNSFTLGAMSDSLYEYLPKMVALLGNTEPMYKQMWRRSAETAIKHTIYRPMTPDGADILMSGMVRTHASEPLRLVPQGQHLVCFAGGMFGLSGRLLQNKEHVELGRKLTDGCIWAYKQGPMGIMPEVYSVLPCPEREVACAWDQEKYEQEVVRIAGEGHDAAALIRDYRLPKGFTDISDRRYILRPEAIESVFLLYRITGEPYLLDAAWDMFQAIVNATETPLANAALRDMTYSPEELAAQQKSVQVDSMESFWMAETLKYFYLIFSEPNVISLDQWVFNTEAHPFKRSVPS